MQLSLTILLTGFAVVFAVLLVLIGVIKLYGTIIYRAQHKNREKPKQKTVTEQTTAPAAAEPLPTVTVETNDEQDDALIAVIAAAVYAMYPDRQVRVRSVRRTPTGSGAWRAAGLRDNTRVF